MLSPLLFLLLYSLPDAGLNDYNEAVLRLHNSETGITMSLKMNLAATQQLIRMLEATLIDKDGDDNDGL